MYGRSNAPLMPPPPWPRYPLVGGEWSEVDAWVKWLNHLLRPNGSFYNDMNSIIGDSPAYMIWDYLSVDMAEESTIQVNGIDGDGSQFTTVAVVTNAGQLAQAIKGLYLPGGSWTPSRRGRR